MVEKGPITLTWNRRRPVIQLTTPWYKRTKHLVFVHLLSSIIIAILSLKGVFLYYLTILLIIGDILTILFLLDGWGLGEKMKISGGASGGSTVEGIPTVTSDDEE